MTAHDFSVTLECGSPCSQPRAVANGKHLLTCENTDKNIQGCLINSFNSTYDSYLALSPCILKLNTLTVTPGNTPCILLVEPMVKGLSKKKMDWGWSVFSNNALTLLAGWWCLLLIYWLIMKNVIIKCIDFFFFTLVALFTLLDDVLQTSNISISVISTAYRSRMSKCRSRLQCFTSDVLFRSRLDIFTEDWEIFKRLFT